MPTSVNAHPDAWMDGVQVNGNDLRLQMAGAWLTGASPSGSTGIAARPGVRYGTGNPLQVNASSGMNITVNAGLAWVQGTASATAGMYTACLDTTATLTVTTSDPTNPRIDNVLAQIVDNGNNTSTTTINIQAGTPAPSPVAPTPPANSLVLATILVGAGVTSITAGNITDKRVYTAATGGIVPMSTSGGISGAAGLYAHDTTTGRLRVSDGSGNARNPKIAPFAPQTSLASGFTTVAVGTPQTPCSLSVTVDGVTEVEMVFSWDLLQVGTATLADNMNIIFQNGASGVRSVTLIPITTTQNNPGGSLLAYVTPAAGTVTLSVQISASGTSGDTFKMYNCSLRASAVVAA